MLPPTPATPDHYKYTKHFGRLKRFDERSLPFSIRANRLTFWRSLTARLRTKINHRVFWQGDQNATSQCGAYSALHAWEAGKGHARSEGHPLYRIGRPISTPLVVYRMAQDRDPWPGSELVEPRYEGTSGTGAAQAMKDLGLITGFDWEFSDVDVCARAIFTAPLIFGTDWRIGMMLDGPPRTDWRDAIIKPTGGIVGGHLWAVVGYDKRRKGAEWEILNSWGYAWGYHGRCFLSHDNLGTLLASDGECVMYRDEEDEIVATKVKKVA